ncbi:hypothetical protein OS493_015296 [Desmophyllum pertusum]|uniref:Uncharacterized protein n=1 Tax=Desmophyllum pertusum TaxID=174260 RepID=A0A9W9ZDH1_9CNID|nr:hypothetical protein OS493_015296 [Desmophyllum pertusum]
MTPEMKLQKKKQEGKKGRKRNVINETEKRGIAGTQGNQRQKNLKAQEHKEATGQSKKASMLPSTSQSSSVLQQEVTTAAAASRQSNSPPHILHVTAGASTSNVPTSLYGTSGTSAPATPLDTFVSGPPHGKQFVAYTKCLVHLEIRPLSRSPLGQHCQKALSSISTSPGTMTKGGSSHTISFIKDKHWIRRGWTSA